MNFADKSFTTLVERVTRGREGWMPSSACGRGSGSAGGILWPRICQYCLDQEIMATSGRRIDLEYTYSSYTAIPSYTQLYTALWPNFPLFDSQWISLQMILQAAEHRTSIVGRKQKQSTFNATFSIILISTYSRQPTCGLSFFSKRYSIFVTLFF